VEKKEGGWLHGGRKAEGAAGMGDTNSNIEHMASGQETARNLIDVRCGKKTLADKKNALVCSFELHDYSMDGKQS
jgi:hypothetical protein